MSSGGMTSPEQGNDKGSKIAGVYQPGVPFAIPACFLPFVRDNCLDFPTIERQRPGYFRWAKHSGQPLTQELWDDLCNLLCPCSLRVFLSGETLDRDVCWYACCIFLDDEYRVQDFWFSPVTLRRKAGVIFVD